MEDSVGVERPEWDLGPTDDGEAIDPAIAPAVATGTERDWILPDRVRGPYTVG